jgi:L-serine dehydratase
MTSIFEIFKIGIGPSSSHTVGPMVAAKRFARSLKAEGELNSVFRVRIDLYGSLAQTGKGHRTDRAVVLGLSGEEPQAVNLLTAEAMLTRVRKTRTLDLLGEHVIWFDENNDLTFNRNQILALHPNGMRFTAYGRNRKVLMAENFYSLGHSIVDSRGRTPQLAPIAVPYQFHSAAELLRLGATLNLPIWKMMLDNECALRSSARVFSGMDQIWRTMQDSIERGMTAIGTLPGGLNVRRRAEGMASLLRAKPANDPLSPLDWVSVYAIAVNEENAAGGRVVTAPTNGAAGIIPAAACYYLDFIPGANRDGLHRFFLTAAAIGVLYKENAPIPGAQLGCQGEVGVAASMAAGGLVAAQGGSNEQVERAAEIAMEQHLGMTCDPIGGLVQVPCIERNAMGAVKAIHACSMAMDEQGGRIGLDRVIETMYRTGLDMRFRYKETSPAGLALNVIEC